jgi:hypothetical protein
MYLLLAGRHVAPADQHTQWIAEGKAMRFIGKSEETAGRIVSLFESGNVPKALAPVFIHRAGNRPCDGWSWSNRFLVALAGHDDARGFRQWEGVGRHVRKGERAFSILGPVLAKKTETDDAGRTIERSICVGFKSIAVFGYSQTDGEPLPDLVAQDRFLEALPLLDVAKVWGLAVQTYNGRDGSALGWYRHGTAIALGVENLSTWAHELVHAAEDRLGNLKGDKRASEVVAELGGAVLLTMLGREHDADLGGAWDYIRGWAGNKHPVGACMAVLNRVCAAVELIVTTSEQTAAPVPMPMPAALAA